MRDLEVTITCIRRSQSLDAGLEDDLEGTARTAQDQNVGSRSASAQFELHGPINGPVGRLETLVETAGLEWHQPSSGICASSKRIGEVTEVRRIVEPTPGAKRLRREERRV
jgi:hypothetical protein